jgi:hypothetical protein
MAAAQWLFGVDRATIQHVAAVVFAEQMLGRQFQRGGRAELGIGRDDFAVGD